MKMASAMLPPSKDVSAAASATKETKGCRAPWHSLPFPGAQIPRAGGGGTG